MPERNGNAYARNGTEKAKISIFTSLSKCLCVYLILNANWTATGKRNGNAFFSFGLVWFGDRCVHVRCML